MHANAYKAEKDGARDFYHKLMILLKTNQKRSYLLLVVNFILKKFKAIN